MILAGPISEMISVVTWVQHLGGLSRLEGFHGEGRSEFIRAASEPLPSAPPLTMPRVLTREEAPSYIDFAPEESRGVLGWMCFAGSEEPRLIAHDLDLISALMFLTQLDTEREYGIERSETGRYLLISGGRGEILNGGDLVLHTHQDGLALPSGPDLRGIEARATVLGRPWSMIYSTPPHEHQLAFVHSLGLLSFEVYLWRDRLDRDERRTSVRHFEIGAVPDPDGGDPFETGRLEVSEHSLESQNIGSWTYQLPEVAGDGIQHFWKRVLG